MGMPGMGVMLHSLGGGSAKTAADYYGRTITSAAFKNDAIYLTFSDGVTIRLKDDGQSCCESRYMTCEDNPESLVGGTLQEIRVKDGGEPPGADEVHETAFLEIQTDKGFITACTHVEHNGYYGGFALDCNEVSE